MKGTTAFLKRIAVTGLLACGMVQLAHAKEATAFELIKEANRHVGVDARDRVVEIRSEKSIGTLEPNIWYIVLQDRQAKRATEIKFAAGNKVAVDDRGKRDEFDRSKMKIDSDQAIQIATTDPLVKNLKLTATELKLETMKYHVAPVWKVELWASKLRDPTREVSIGKIFIDAETGKVVKNELKISRVD